MDYGKHIESQTAARHGKHPISPGDTVFWHMEYDICSGLARKVNAKGVRVLGPHGERNIPAARVVRAGTPAVLVWEMWKGANGAGGYRWDTSLYPDVHMPVEKIPHQTYLDEGAFGAATAQERQAYLDRLPVRRRAAKSAQGLLDMLSGM